MHLHLHPHPHLSPKILTRLAHLGQGVRHGLWHARFVLSFVLVLAVLGTALVCVVSGGIADVTAPYILSPDGLGTLPDGERFDCVLILGAGLRPDGSPSDMLADRVRIGCAVYLSDPARFGALLLSGDRTGDYNEVAAMRELAVSLGVPEDRILCDYEGFSTFESVSRARECSCTPRSGHYAKVPSPPRRLYRPHPRHERLRRCRRPRAPMPTGSAVRAGKPSPASRIILRRGERAQREINRRVNSPVRRKGACHDPERNRPRYRCAVPLPAGAFTAGACFQYVRHIAPPRLAQYGRCTAKAVHGILPVRAGAWRARGVGSRRESFGRTRRADRTVYPLPL